MKTYIIARSFSGLLISLLVLGAAGCGISSDDEIIYSAQPGKEEAYVPVEEGDFFFAVAVSGGGSRSAVWSAAVLKELSVQVKLSDGRSITDEIDYISSVSGGSISSAYFCLNKPEEDTTHTDQYERFFDRFLADMRTNIQGEMIAEPNEWYRIFISDEKKGIILKEELDKHFFSRRTFDDLYSREKKKVCPTLIINGTEMDSGSKFLFTTLPRSEFKNRSLLSSLEVDKSGIMKSNIMYEQEVLGVTLCSDIGLSIGDMEVSRAVVASAGVPLLFGPVVLKDANRSTPDREAYVHINDGGISDTLGLETLVQLFLNRFDRAGKRGYTRGLILIIDANRRLDPEDSLFTVKGFGPARLIERSREIMAYRGKNLAYLTIMLLQQDPRYRDIRFVCLSPYMADDPRIIDMVKKTPIRLKIKPEQADNLEYAAKIVVAKLKKRILANLHGRDLPGGGPAFIEEK